LLETFTFLDKNRKNVHKLLIFNSIDSVVVKYMREGIGRFVKSDKSFTGSIYIPAKIVSDSTFPLVDGKVKICIEGNYVIVCKESEPSRIKTH